MTKWKRQACQRTVRTSKPRLTPNIPIHCLAPPIFEKPKAQPQHQRKDKTVKSYQSSGRQTKSNESVPCLQRVAKVLAMRKIGLPGQDFDSFHQGLRQAYDEDSSSSARIFRNCSSRQTTTVLGVKLPRISSNRSGRKRGLTGDIPDRPQARGIVKRGARAQGAQRCAPDWGAS